MLCQGRKLPRICRESKLLAQVEAARVEKVAKTDVAKDIRILVLILANRGVHPDAKRLIKSRYQRLTQLHLPPNSNQFIKNAKMSKINIGTIRLNAKEEEIIDALTDVESSLVDYIAASCTGVSGTCVPGCKDSCKPGSKTVPVCNTGCKDGCKNGCIETRKDLNSGKTN